MKENISNIKLYNDRMDKSMLDKIYFIDKIHIKPNQRPVFIDYGCADGTMLNEIYHYYPNSVFMGFDVSQKQLDLAEVKLGHNKGMKFVLGNTMSHLITEYDMSYKKPNDVLILVFSSVIHEIYSYGGLSEVKYFKYLFTNDMFNYIVVRDMIPSENINRPTDVDDLVHFHFNIKRLGLESYLKDFETKWGSVDNNKNMIHFLLKYRYTNNWEREVQENYLPIYKKDLLSLINPNTSEIVYQEHFILPYIKETVMEDFNIKLKDNTHFKLILKNRKNK